MTSTNASIFSEVSQELDNGVKTLYRKGDSKLYIPNEGLDKPEQKQIAMDIFELLAELEATFGKDAVVHYGDMDRAYVNDHNDSIANTFYFNQDETNRRRSDIRYEIYNRERSYLSRDDAKETDKFLIHRANVDGADIHMKNILTLDSISGKVYFELKIASFALSIKAFDPELTSHFNEATVNWAKMNRDLPYKTSHRDDYDKYKLNLIRQGGISIPEVTRIIVATRKHLSFLLENAGATATPQNISSLNKLINLKNYKAIKKVFKVMPFLDIDKTKEASLAELVAQNVDYDKLIVILASVEPPKNHKEFSLLAKMTYEDLLDHVIGKVEN